MTIDKDFKNLVRERMAKTGESYAAARAQVLASREVSAQPRDGDRSVRVIHEASWRWAARDDAYPELVGHGSTQDEAKHRLFELITQYESDWRNQIDDENVQYIELQDD